VSLQVHPLNRARVFYQRLGFRERARQPGPFVEMYWRDPATTPERL
jgi:catechol-2,3-dioxygenase